MISVIQINSIESFFLFLSTDKWGHVSRCLIWAGAQYLLAVSGLVLFALRTQVDRRLWQRADQGVRVWLCMRMCACVFVCTDLLWGEVRAQAQPQGRCDWQMQQKHQRWLCPAWLFHQDLSHWLYDRWRQGQASQHGSELEGLPLGVLMGLTWGLRGWPLGTPRHACSGLGKQGPRRQCWAWQAGTVGRYLGSCGPHGGSSPWAAPPAGSSSLHTPSLYISLLVSYGWDNKLPQI